MSTEATQPEPQERGIIAWFARNPVAANLLMVFLLLGGAWSAFTIRKEFFPEFSLDAIIVQVPYLGAAPEEVEEGVCIKIEEAIQDLEGIKKMTSTAREGFGTVRIEVDSGYDVLDMLDKIKLRVDAIATFPENTEKPVIFDQVIRNEVIWVQLYGNADERTLKEYGKSIRDEIIDLPAVTQAELVGDRDYEISIEVSESQLRSYGLTFDDLVRAIRRSSVDLPGGSIKTAGGEVLLRAKGQAYRGGEFEQLVLMTRPDGTHLRLGDIATVVDGFEDEEFFFNFDGQHSLGIRVYRVGDESTLDVAKAVRDYVNEKQVELPEGISLAYWGDSSRLLQGRLNLMLKNALFGGILVFLLLTIFLRLQLAFWVMLGLPICFLGTILVMPLDPFDVSVNMISLFAFIVVLGIVVDDAIVIGENVFTTVKRDGMSTANVIKGAREVAMAATFGVLTTVAAFLPMLMVPGSDGKIWANIGLVVILCLLFSLVESKLILPAHLAHMTVGQKPREKMSPLARLQRSIADGLERFVEKRYTPALAVAMKRRYLTFALFVGALILTIGLVTGGHVRQVFFPVVESDFINVNLTMAEGTPFKRTEMAALQIDDALKRVNEEAKADNKGDPVLEHSISWSRSETSVGFYVELTPGEDRELGTIEVVNRWRKAVGAIPGSTELTFSGMIGSSGAAVEFQLEGENVEELDAAAAELKEHLATYAGVFDIQDSFSSGKQEIQLDIKESAEVLGLTLDDLARQVRQGFYGAEAQRIQRGKDEIRVMVRYPAEERRSIGNLENMRIRTPMGDEVPFSSVAEAEMGRGYSTIRRVDRKRVVNVTADVDKETAEPGKIVEAVNEEFMPGLLQRYPTVGATLEGESRDQQEAMASLFLGFILVQLIIYALMAIPLKSYVKPLIIMSVIPFGIIGAVFGHYFMGLFGPDMPLSILSLCGIIALTGVVVNDSLVMVDFINRYEAQTGDHQLAVRMAGPARFRAILLTSLTTFFGLLPMILEQSMQARFLIPMAVSLAFGILFATVITLFLIPALYLIMDDCNAQLKRFGNFWLRLYSPNKYRELTGRDPDTDRPLAGAITTGMSASPSLPSAASRSEPAGN